MANAAKRIAVPKTPKESFNPDRPASSLLKSQTVHLHAALTKHLAEVQAVAAIDPRGLTTERQISEYVKKATAILHLYASQRGGK
jgi:hypothetical protein